MTAAPTIGILAVQGDVREHAGALSACGARVVPVRRPGELDRLDGLVLPGGESTTIDKLVRAFGLLGPLQAFIGSGRPVYGSCAGMILLADRLLDPRSGQQTLGGLDVTVRRNAFGRQVDSFEEDLSVAGIAGVPQSPKPMRGVFIRAPWIEEVGPGVEVLATVRSGPAAGRPVAVRQGAVLATAFHPEVTGDLRVHAHVVAAAGGRD